MSEPRHTAENDAPDTCLLSDHIRRRCQHANPAATYRCSQEPHPGREFYGDGGCAECGYRPPADEPTDDELAEWLRQGRNGPRIAGPALAMGQTEALARAWEEGWNAAVDSGGFPYDRNPYCPIPPEVGQP